MFVIDIQYKVSLNVVDEYVVAHRAWLDEKYTAGLLLCSGPKLPKTGGVIIALGDDIAQIQHMLQTDPFMQHGIGEYTITEFQPVKHHPQIKNLII